MGTVPATNKVEDNATGAASLTDIAIQVTGTSYAHRVFKQGSSTLHPLVRALEMEGLADRKGDTGFVVLAVEIKPFSTDMKEGALQVIPPPKSELAGYCVVRKPEGWIGKDHNRLYQVASMVKVRVPACNKHDSLLLLVRVSAPKNTLPKTDAAIKGFLQLKVVEP